MIQVNGVTLILVALVIFVLHLIASFIVRSWRLGGFSKWTGDEFGRFFDEAIGRMLYTIILLAALAATVADQLS